MADPPDRAELRVGEQVSYELPGLGTAGYVWDEEVEGDDGVVSVSWKRGWPPGEEPLRSAGASAPEVVAIAGLRRGTVVVRLVQHRRWEPPDQAIAEHRITVAVDPAPSGA